MKKTSFSLWGLLLLILLGSSCSEEAEPLESPTFPSINMDNITLTLAANNIVSDGISYAEFILKVDPSIAKVYKDVICKVSPIGKFPNGSGSLNEKIDINGELKLFVTSSVAGTASLTVEIVNLGTKSASVHFVNINSAISLTLTKDSIVADGNTFAEFLLKIDTPVSKTFNTVKFNLPTIGKFPDGSNSLEKKFDINGEAKVFVSSSAIGIATLYADIVNVGSKSASAYFISSFPDQILMLPAVSTMTSGFASSSLITAKLIRINGTVSGGLFVSFSDSSINNTSVGTFLNTSLSNNAGESTTTYTLQDTSYHGLVYIKSTIMTGAGLIKGRCKILIQ